MEMRQHLLGLQMVDTYVAYVHVHMLLHAAVVCQHDWLVTFAWAVLCAGWPAADKAARHLAKDLEVLLKN